MKRMMLVFWLGLYLHPARADLFGGDVVVLSQILTNAVQQLAEIREVVGIENRHLELVREINSGIHDSLRMMRTIDPNVNPGIYQDLRTARVAVRRLESVYGKVTESSESQAQKDIDQGIAEAIVSNNAYYEHSKVLDVLSEQIKEASHSVSPLGSERLTAQSLGLVIQALSHSLRAQATTMKLEAQGLALQNKREKAETSHFLDTGKALGKKLKSEKVRFEVPRF